jgi:hypothetical protein
MMKKLVLATAISMSLLALSATAAETTKLSTFFAEDGRVTTEQTYPTIETQRQMVKTQEAVGLNTFLHYRELTPTDKQDVVRMNRDTYYSRAVINVSKGATITLPEIEKGKYMSLEVITEDHRIQPMQYGAGTYNLTTHKGDYVYVIIRTDATWSEAEVRKVQDKMVINSRSDTEFVTDTVNEAVFDKVENGLKAQVPALFAKHGSSDGITFGAFTAPTDNSKELFNKTSYAVGAALGWGGAQLVDNLYEVSGKPYPADVCHQATFKDPKNKGFMSVTVYDKFGFMFNDKANINTETAVWNDDGTMTISFGCGENAINNIPTVEGNKTGVFSLAFRHYIPSDAVRNEGYRLLPFVQPVK